MIDKQADTTANSLDVRRHYGFGWVWRRLLAGVVDWLVVLGWGAGFGTMCAVFFGLLNVSSFGLNFILGSIFLGFPVMCAVVIWKHVAMAFRISSTGQTLGHQFFGLRISTNNGEMMSRCRALVRQILGSPLLFAYFLPMILLTPLVPVAMLAMLTDLLGGLGYAFVTNWLVWGLLVSLVLAAINHVWMGFDAEGRVFHDLIVGTVVVGGRIVRRDPDAMTTLAADRTRGDLDYPAAHRVF